MTRPSTGLPSTTRAWVAAVILLLPVSAFAQDGAYVQGRLNAMQRQLNELSAKIELLGTQDQQLQQRLESMRTNLEARFDRLEKGSTSSKAPVPRSGK